jgi:hypothetical protein
MLLGRAVDVTPFIFSGRVQGGVIWEPGGSVVCSQDYTGNFTVGEPVLYQGLCASSGVAVVPDLLLLHGDWTARGSFRIGAARLSPESDEAGLVLLGGTGPIHSEDADRLVVAGNGMAQLVRRGRTPRCVALTDSARNRWMVPVVPPAPQELVVTLSHTDLVVQQDVWRLVPSSTRLASALVRFTDDTSMDVSGRLVRSASQRLRVRDDAAETLHESGPANITFSLVGMPCMHATAPVRVHSSSVLSATLECESCPTQLAERTDPLARRWPEQFPSAVDGKAFQVRRRLVDGTTHVKQEPLQITINGALEEGRLVAQSRGVLGVTTAFTRNTVTLEVLDRWAVDWRVLCNGRVCDEALKLAPLGDGAGLPPFRYATRLDLGFELALLNGTRLTGLELAVGGMMVSFGAELAHLFITLMACFSRDRTANAMEKAIVSFCTRAEKEIDDEASSCKMIRDLNLDLTGKMKELVELEIENHKDMKTLRTKLNNLNIVSASESSSGSSTVSNGEITRESATTAGSDDEKKQTGDKSPTPSSGCSAASTSRVD